MKFVSTMSLSEHGYPSIRAMIQPLIIIPKSGINVWKLVQTSYFCYVEFNWLKKDSWSIQMSFMNQCSCICWHKLNSQFRHLLNLIGWVESDMVEIHFLSWALFLLKIPILSNVKQCCTKPNDRHGNLKNFEFSTNPDLAGFLASGEYFTWKLAAVVCCDLSLVIFQLHYLFNISLIQCMYLLTAASQVYREQSAQSAWMATRISPVRAVLCVLVMAKEAWVKCVIILLASAHARWETAYC